MAPSVCPFPRLYSGQASTVVTSSRKALTRGRRVRQQGDLLLEVQRVVSRQLRASHHEGAGRDDRDREGARRGVHGSFPPAAPRRSSPVRIPGSTPGLAAGDVRGRGRPRSRTDRAPSGRRAPRRPQAERRATVGVGDGSGGSLGVGTNVTVGVGSVSTQAVHGSATSRGDAARSQRRPRAAHHQRSPPRGGRTGGACGGRGRDGAGAEPDTTLPLSRRTDRPARPSGPGGQPRARASTGMKLERGADPVVVEAPRRPSP